MGFYQFLARVGPPYMQGYWARKFWSQIGLQMDRTTNEVTAGMWSRFPDSSVYDHVVRAKIVTGGALETMTVQFSIDGGDYGDAVTSGAAPWVYVVPGTLAQLAFTAGTYVQNAVWTFNPDLTMVEPGGNPAVGYLILPAQALDEIGKDRQMPHGGTAVGNTYESNLAYAARLREAWTTWGQDPDTGGGAGSMYGILKALAALGYPKGTTGITLVNHVGRYAQLASNGTLVTGDSSTCVNRKNMAGTVPGTLKGFTLDVRDQWYAHFGLVIGQDIPALTDAAGNPNKAELNQTIQRWKSAKSIYHGAMVLPDGALWGWPTTTVWGQSGLTWGDYTAQPRFISPT